MSDTVLASWNKGKAKDAILGFVERTTTDGPDFVAQADRIATFDNDGTLWVEQPLPPQFDFVFRHWAEEVKRDPSMASQQPYKAVIERDPGERRRHLVVEPTILIAVRRYTVTKRSTPSFTSRAQLGPLAAL